MVIKKLAIVLTVLIILAIPAIVAFKMLPSEEKEIVAFSPKRVAHSGGEINGKTYTNSIDALNHNLKKGFDYFELDFVFTGDGHLVCMHDWEQDFKNAFDFDVSGRLTLDTFNYLIENSAEFEKCTIYSLIEWLKDNPGATIITDIKENNLYALKIISEKVPNFKDRIIPQIYNPRNYPLVKELGYNQIIWTLYKYDSSDNKILSYVESFEGPFAITMNKKRAVTTLPRELAKRNITTYVHTVNSILEKEDFMNLFSITEIYTDFLDPKNYTNSLKENYGFVSEYNL
ncbi:glycerophosphodiester phosphodiesterase family protein [Nanoarchaeota archaeon]